MKHAVKLTVLLFAALPFFGSSPVSAAPWPQSPGTGGGGPTTSPGTGGGSGAKPGDVTPSGAAPGTTGGSKPTYTGPNAPTTPTGGASSPRTPGAVVPGSPAPGAATQPRSPRGSGITSDDPGTWRAWWTLNHDRYVDVAAQAPQAATDDLSGERTGVLSQARMDAWERLAPIVMAAIHENQNEIVLGRALIALAKLGEDPRLRDSRSPDSRKVFEAIRPYLRHAKTRVAESAAVALGILGHEESIVALSEFAAEKPSTGVESRQERVRAFAIYGIGLAARESKREDARRLASSRLCALFAEHEGKTPDVKVACLQALSLSPVTNTSPESVRAGATPSASRVAQVEWVLRVLDDEDELAAVRAQAATTAARLCAGEPDGSLLREQVADRLIQTLSRGSRDGLPVRQSAALALGLVGDADKDPQDVEVRTALMAAILFGGDQATRYFAGMALAEVASRPGGPPSEADRLAAAGDARELLIKRLGAGSETDRAWTALSLGVFEYWMRQAGEEASQEARAALRGTLESTHSPEIAGATALALGLCGASEAQELLARELDSGDGNVRGFASLALGMVGARDARERIAKLLERADSAPEMIVPLCEGLALLGTPPVEPLLAALGAGLGLEAQLSACIALGRTGGGRAVQPLSELLGDATGTAWVRAMAVEALGSIGDHGATRWNARYAFDVNFLALPLSATAPTFDGVLDLE